MQYFREVNNEKVKEVEVADEEEVQEEMIDPNAFRIEVTKQGDGQIPPIGSKVEVHYTGKLMDGTVFDSSVSRNRPFSFTLGKGQVIKCWDEGVSQLPVGSHATLTCPPEMAYGSRGAGGTIPPNATLKFDVQVLDFKK